ncbi:hypothetical protein CRUP_022084 [Coryphaenoides rupestris]|nr:hypothetical protein CRUP_022084 [Coryphaenoides rupestris]
MHGRRHSATELGSPTVLCQISCPVECEVSAWSAWGPCTFENCQDQTAKKGDFVERQLCRDAILPMPAICEVPCPKDCALSPWTPWSLCSHTCSGKNTEGRQMRARSILAYNAGEGTVTFHTVGVGSVAAAVRHAAAAAMSQVSVGGGVSATHGGRQQD